MSNLKPIVIKGGQLQQIQSGDLLVDSEDHAYVDAENAFGTDDVLVASDGTGRGVKATAINKDNVVQAASAFGTDNSILTANGTGRGAQASGFTIDDDGVISGSTVADSAAVVPIFTVVDASPNEVFSIRTSNYANGNIFIGSGQENGTVTGTNNIFVGKDSGGSLTSGINNFAIGGGCLTSLTEGSNNAAVGVSCGANITTGAANTIIGTSAGNGITTQNLNTVIGRQAAESFAGALLTAIGWRAGRSVTSGNDNVFVGAQAGENASQAASVTNSIAIGADAHTTASNQAVFGNSSITETILFGSVESDGGFGFYDTSPPSVQPSHIDDAEETHSFGTGYDATELQNAMDALGGKINDILSVLEGYGMTAES